MNTAEQILVITLASALALFLILAIIAAVYTIRVLKTMNRIASKAEGFVDSAEAMGELVRHTVKNLSLLRMLKGVADFVHHRQDDNKGERSK